MKYFYKQSGSIFDIRQNIDMKSTSCIGIVYSQEDAKLIVNLLNENKIEKNYVNTIIAGEGWDA